MIVAFAYRDQGFENSVRVFVKRGDEFFAADGSAVRIVMNNEVDFFLFENSYRVGFFFVFLHRITPFSLSGRPPHFLTCQNMNMQMEHALPRVIALIYNEPIAAL